MTGRRVLVVGGVGLLDHVRLALGAGGDVVEAVGSGRAALEAVERAGWEVALVDLALPDMAGPELVRRLREKRPSLSVVAVTGRGERSQGLAARQAGAHTFLEAPDDLEREKILVAVENAVEHRRLTERVAPTSLNLEAREREAILVALERTGWNKQAAAGLLGLHRPTLYSKMKKHEIPQRRPV